VNASANLPVSIEAVQQLTRALTQIARSASEPALRREEIKLQLAFSNAVMLTKGYAAPETKAAFDRASALVERAQALGETKQPSRSAISVRSRIWNGCTQTNFRARLRLEHVAGANEMLRSSRQNETKSQEWVRSRPVTRLISASLLSSAD
jgi:hypothetical protein